MVAKVIPVKGVRNPLQYNEQKLKTGAAQLIHSMGFGKDTDQLGFADKMGRFEKLISLNERTQYNTLHISLNFDPSENPDKEILRQIADAYMQKIGFGHQPYLVYQHFDAGHNHVHILTTNIQSNGKAINLNNIGRNQSSKARREIEQEFGLVVAGKQQEKIVNDIKPVSALKVQYGRSSTKRAITNVLDVVVKQYKYTSLAELNAVLKQYNVLADQGGKDSRTYQRNGLYYRALDEKGNKIGAPIKASDFYSKPTMKFLEGKFQENEPIRQPFKQRIRNAVDFTLAKNSGCSLQELTAALQKDKIQLVIRRNDVGNVYGITYVDTLKKVVFNGSDLGKAYSAKQLLERMGQQPGKPEQEMKPELKQPPIHNSKMELPSKSVQKKEKSALAEHTSSTVESSKSVEQLAKEILATGTETGMESELRQEPKKKRKKKLRH